MVWTWPCPPCRYGSAVHGCAEPCSHHDSLIQPWSLHVGSHPLSDVAMDMVCSGLPELFVMYMYELHFSHFCLWSFSLQIMINSYAGLKDQEARQHLGSFGLSGPLALQPMYTLSGGQKSRVALAKVGMGVEWGGVGPGV